MINFLAVILLGWPAVVVTIILAIVGLWRRDYRFLVVAAILALPFSWLLSGFPLVRSPAFLLPVMLFTSGYFMYREWEMWAWLVFVPYLMSIWLLLNAVMSQ